MCVTESKAHLQKYYFATKWCWTISKQKILAMQEQKDLMTRYNFIPRALQAKCWKDAILTYSMEKNAPKSVYCFMDHSYLWIKYWLGGGWACQVHTKERLFIIDERYEFISERLCAALWNNDGFVLNWNFWNIVLNSFQESLGFSFQFEYDSNQLYPSRVLKHSDSWINVRS